eukprot:14369657-Heterocapsa_arctica.AAC.1
MAQRGQRVRALQPAVLRHEESKGKSQNGFSREPTPGEDHSPLLGFTVGKPTPGKAPSPTFGVTAGELTTGKEQSPFGVTPWGLYTWQQ